MKNRNMTAKQALSLIEKLAGNSELMEILGDAYGGADVSRMFDDFADTLKGFDPETVFRGEEE